MSPPDVEAPGSAATDQALKWKADDGDYARVAAADKAFQTLRAELARAGFELHAVSAGEGGAEFVVQRWAMHKTLPDLAAVEHFLVQIGGAR